MPISCDSQYIIDSLIELLEITPDIYEFCWSQQVDVDALVDHNQGVQEHIKAYFESAYTGLSVEQQASLGFEVLLCSDRQVDEFFRHLSGKVVDAFYRGTGLRVPHPEMMARNETTTITDHTDLTQILQVFDETPIFASYRDRFQQSLRRSLTSISQVDMPAYVGFKKTEIYRNQLALEELRALRPQLQEHLDEVDVDFNERHVAVEKKKQRLGRKVLKKSIKVLDSFMGNGTTSAFVHGDKVTITGERFKFIIEQSGVKLVDHSADPKSYHVPYKLTITDLSDILLGQACLLFRDTPILDQILTIHLHVMGGKEDELIKTANFFRTTEAFYKDPNMMELRGQWKLKEPGYRGQFDDEPWNPLVPGFRRARAAEEYFALRGQVNDYLIANYAEQLLGVSTEAVNFLLHPPIHKHELEQLVQVKQFTQLFSAQGPL